MARPDRYETEELTLYLHHETHEGEASMGAIKVSDDGVEARAVWLPKSQVTWRSAGKGNIIIADVPMWLAEEKGLV